MPNADTLYADGQIEELVHLADKLGPAAAMLAWQLANPQWANEAGMALQVATLIAYGVAGEQRFVLPAKLQTAFAASDVDGAPGDLIKPPFDAFCVEAKDSPIRIPVAGGGVATLREIYVSFLKGHGIAMSARFVNGALGMVCDFMHHFDGDDRFKLGSPSPFAIHPALDACMRPDLTRTAYEELWAELIRIVINLLLYLQTRDADQVVDDSNKKRALELQAKFAAKKSGGKKAKLQRKLGRVNRATMIYVGRKFENDESIPSGKHNNWTVRRGHFHAFWFGARKLADGTRRLGDERVIKWVMPVWNPKGEVAGPHTYKFAGRMPTAPISQ